MKKRLILNILAAILLLSTLAPMASATQIASGTCGEGITWTLNGYTLTISGSGEMEDGSPWAEYKDHIENVILTGGITKIGKEAFSGFDRLETVDFGDALVEIGEKAFYGCEDIVYIHLPDTFRTFGTGSFRECISLKYVYCDGPMPRFNDSCLWTGNYIAVFYPSTNPWPQESVSQLVSNFGGRLGIMMGNYDAASVAAELAEAEDDDAQTEATEASTEAPTEAPTEAAAEPAAAAVTEPVTEATEPETQPTETTVSETEETTVPTTEAVETTEATEVTEEETEETEPRTVAEKVGGDGWIGMVIVAGVLTFLLAGAMIFRSISRKGGQYTE